MRMEQGKDLGRRGLDADYRRMDGCEPKGEERACPARVTGFPYMVKIMWSNRQQTQSREGIIGTCMRLELICPKISGDSP